jgi:stress-induced morphogen
VYESLDELMTQDIHALSIEALAPTETLESTT